MPRSRNAEDTRLVSWRSLSVWSLLLFAVLPERLLRGLAVPQGHTRLEITAGKIRQRETLGLIVDEFNLLRKYLVLMPFSECAVQLALDDAGFGLFRSAGIPLGAHAV